MNKNNNQYNVNRRIKLFNNRPDRLTPDEKQLIKYNKKIDL